MKFFIDSVDLEAISQLNELGIVDGITTNPSIIAKSGYNYCEILKEICSIIKGPVSAEVVADEPEQMLKEAEVLARIANNIVIKLPINFNGVKICKILSDKGINTNMTLCFSASQALLVAKAGAKYVSPFVGRLDDVSHDGLELVSDIVNIFKNYEFKTKILVASVRNPIHIIKSAKLGADIVTVPPKIVYELLKHPLTDKGIEIFNKDWEKTGQKIVI